MATTTTERKRSKHIRIGLYADPGAGKTDFVGSSQKLGRTLIIRPPVDHTDSILEWGPNLEERVVHDWGEMLELLDELRQEGDKYAWVWVDSISLLQDVLLDDELDTEINKISRDAARRKLFGPDQGVYGRNMYRIGWWMRYTIGPDLFNFGWTAHSAELLSPDRDKDGDPVEKLMPWIQGKQMSPKLCGYMGMVAWMSKTKKGSRVLKVTSDDVHYAKDQYDAVPDKGIIIPRGEGMPKLTNLIYKSRPYLKKTAAGKTRRPASRAGRKTTRKGR